MWRIERFNMALGRAKQFPPRPLDSTPCLPMLLSSFLSTTNFPSKMMVAIFFLVYFSKAAAKPVPQMIHIARTDQTGLELVDLAFSIKMAETALAIFSVTLVIITYSVLIQRGSFMSTTAMYPQHSIERNIGSLLSLAWPRRSNEALHNETNLRTDSKASSRPARPSQIQLFYLGRMNTDNHSGIVYKFLISYSGLISIVGK